MTTAPQLLQLQLQRITNGIQLLTLLIVQTLRLYTMTTSANLIPHLLITAANYATIAMTNTAALL